MSKGSGGTRASRGRSGIAAAERAVEANMGKYRDSLAQSRAEIRAREVEEQKTTQIGTKGGYFNAYLNSDFRLNHRNYNRDGDEYGTNRQGYVSTMDKIKANSKSFTPKTSEANYGIQSMNTGDSRVFHGTDKFGEPFTATATHEKGGRIKIKFTKGHN